MKKRIVSLLMALVILCDIMPMTAFATEGTQETEAVEVVTEPSEAPEEETTAPAEETEPSEEEEKTESPDEEKETEPSEPSEPEEEAEVIHEHDYEAVVTDPTCTEQGYTTYTCECGESYVGEYVDQMVHSYENTICINCGCYETCVPSDKVDVFIFAGQSNMMGASVLKPEVDTFTDKSLEYKYVPKLRGAETGSFVSAQNPAGEFHYNDLHKAYGDKLNDLSYKSTLSNYSVNTYFCPAMRDELKSFSSQSEANTYPSASLAPYFVTEYAEYGHSSIYAHMAKGAVKVDHYFNEEMATRYNTLITEYNTQNKKYYRMIDPASLSGASNAFDDKYKAMLEDYTMIVPNGTVTNKCFVWLQGEGDAGGSYIEYKLKLQVLWEYLQELDFTHFFVLRVGYWGNTNILNVIKAQEDFCAENENCYIVTRAPSLIPYPSRTTNNWWINEPSEEYDNCRDSYLVDSSNNHFNEKAMVIFAKRSAENIHRILYLGLDPVLEEENIKGMQVEEEKPEIEDATPYTSYIGTETFCNGLSISQNSNVWRECASVTAASTDLISVNSMDSVWIQYVFFKNEVHAVGGFYDVEGNLVVPLYFKNFGFIADASTGGVTAFKTPTISNRVSIAAVEASTGTKIAYVRFSSWLPSIGGHANTEARIYHEVHTHNFSSGLCTLCGAKDPSIQQGDVNFDGIIDASDVNYIYRSVMGYVTLTEAQKLFADFNGDDIVNSSDVNLLYRYVIGEIKSAQS